jgi:hypothetical protein
MGMRRLGVLVRVALAVAIAQLAWTWLQRHDSDLRLRRMLAGRVAQKESAKPDAGPGVRIEQFYARSGEITDAENTLICYGVRNARSVRLEPPVEKLAPSLTRCFFVEPKEDTRYTLTAEGDDGATATESFEVKVRPAPPVFRLFAVSDKEIPRGEVLTVCYGVERATGVRLEPGGWKLPASPKTCIRFYPKQSTEYSLIASGATGGEQRERFKVAVK